jgi:ATP-dependent DNA ligase
MTANRLQVCRAGMLVRLFARRGFASSGRYFAISAASSKLAAESFRLDEALMCGPLAH